MTNEPNHTGEDEPLYVRVPGYLHQYLDDIKATTAITKTDVVTLLLEISYKYLSPESIKELFDEYLILGREGIHLSTVEHHLLTQLDGPNEQDNNNVG